MAATVPVTEVSGSKVADALQQQAFDSVSPDSYCYPNLEGLTGDAIAADTGLMAADQIAAVDACPLNALNCYGSCGDCPESNCIGTQTTIPGPVVNLACPVVNTVAQPVCLESPAISPLFPTINMAPETTLALPKVTTRLNCYDITCNGCGCPVRPPVDP